MGTHIGGCLLRRYNGDNVASQNIYILKGVPNVTLISRLERDFPRHQVKSSLQARFLLFLTLTDLVRGEGAGMTWPLAHGDQLQGLGSFSLL